MTLSWLAAALIAICAVAWYLPLTAGGYRCGGVLHPGDDWTTPPCTDLRSTIQLVTYPVFLVALVAVAALGVAGMVQARRERRDLLAEADRLDRIADAEEAGTDMPGSGR
jgi:hypothetical protein